MSWQDTWDGNVKGFYVYILLCADGSFYTGWTLDLQKRLADHGKGTASKYTRARLPVTQVYFESLPSKREAMQREFAIKKLTRKQKEILIGVKF